MLEAQGSSAGGLSRRLEYNNWPLTTPEPDLALLEGLDLAFPLDPQQLRVVFHTDFKRRCARLRWRNSHIEVALERGRCAVAPVPSSCVNWSWSCWRMNQLDLLDLAYALAHEYPLMPGDITKAERGYRLYALASAGEPTQMWRWRYPVGVATNRRWHGCPAARGWRNIIWRLAAGGVLRQWRDVLGSLRAALVEELSAMPWTEGYRLALVGMLAEWHSVMESADRNSSLYPAVHSRFCWAMQSAHRGVFYLGLVQELYGQYDSEPV